MRGGIWSDHVESATFEPSALSIDANERRSGSTQVVSTAPVTQHHAVYKGSCRSTAVLPRQQFDPAILGAAIVICVGGDRR